MKLYVVRHCERYSSPLYKSELTEHGHFKAKELAIRLYENNIKKIYCSPYLRCMETIQPYSHYFNILPNVEYGISENNFTIIEKDINLLLNDFNINSDYKSKVSIRELNDTNYNINNTIYRVCKLVKQILEDNRDFTDNIVICTHMTIVNIILYLFNKISYDDIIVYTHQNYGELIEIDI
jgi:broad specificity phosphatase PhoE